MTTTTRSIPVEGDCSDRFAAVREALEENFASRAEIGSAVCVYHATWTPPARGRGAPTPSA